MPRRSSIFCQPFLNIFSSETAWPIKVKFHVKHPWEGEQKVCIYKQSHDKDGRHAHMIYGENL